MEARRKAEELERLRQEELDRKAALALQAQLEKEAQEDAQYRQQLEQERRDHELALRLAHESNGQIEDSPPVMRKYAVLSCQLYSLKSSTWFGFSLPHYFSHRFNFVNIHLKFCTLFLISFHFLHSFVFSFFLYDLNFHRQISFCFISFEILQRSFFHV